MNFPPAGDQPGLPLVPFGSFGRMVTRVGLGGEGVLRTHGRSEEARAVIKAALAQGIGYFDTAPAYAGSQGYLGSVWKEGGLKREALFQTSKSAGRTSAQARADLERSLTTLGLDYLDLWQIHDLRTEEEFRTIAGPGGALEAFVRARDQGLVRAIGVTGHHDPELLTRAVDQWPLDSVLLPVNPVEAGLSGFLTSTLPLAREKGLAVIGMKALGGGRYLAPEMGLTAEALLRFALAQPLTVLIVGCSNPEEAALLARAGREPEVLSAQEEERIKAPYLPQAEHLAFYRGVL
jgi:aryl-alcohol dehydrogenase-like predicted oxidoreductase